MAAHRSKILVVDDTEPNLVARALLTGAGTNGNHCGRRGEASRLRPAKSISSCSIS
jgi:hypothetical protein